MEYPKQGMPVSRKEALDAADREFSLLMRAYWAVNGEVECITCGARMPWKGTGIAHWGHYMNREFMWTRWDVTNGGVQCEGCNCFGDGMQDVMRARLIGRHGEEEVERIEREHKKLLKITAVEIIDLADYFRQKRFEIEAEKQL